MVVGNAGGTGAEGPLVLTDRAAFLADLETHVLGTFQKTKAAAPSLARSDRGSIVVVSSIAGVRAHRLMGPYSVSKSAVDMLVRNAADELGRYGIRVNGVRPSLVPTGATGPIVGHDATRRDYLGQMPLGRLGTPADVAAHPRSGDLPARERALHLHRHTDPFPCCR